MKQLLFIGFLAIMTVACGGGASTTTEDKKTEEKAPESKATKAILGAWMLIKIGQEETPPGYVITFKEGGIYTTEGGPNDAEEAKWSLENKEGKDFLTIPDSKGSLTNEIKQLDDKTMILIDGPEDVVFAKQ